MGQQVESNAADVRSTGEAGTVEVGRTSSGTPLVALPPPPKGFEGSSEVKKDNYKVTVSNKDGYLSNLVVDALFDTTPENIFALFTHSDNSAAFRDIKSIAGRKVVEMDGKRSVVEVEQVGEMRVLWMKKYFSTFLKVTEDATNPQHMVIVFELMKSDVLERFHGRWDLEPEVDKKTGRVKCKSRLTQDVSPKGVPPFLAHLPVLGGMLRGIGVRTARRIIEDVNSVVAKFKEGKTVDEVLASLKPAGEPQHKDPNVASFAIDEEDGDDETAAADVVDKPQSIGAETTTPPSSHEAPVPASAASENESSSSAAKSAEPQALSVTAPTVTEPVATPAKGDIGVVKEKVADEEVADTAQLLEGTKLA